jgi:hypothetical protein
MRWFVLAYASMCIRIGIDKASAHPMHACARIRTTYDCAYVHSNHMSVRVCAFKPHVNVCARAHSKHMCVCRRFSGHHQELYMRPSASQQALVHGWSPEILSPLQVRCFSFGAFIWVCVNWPFGIYTCVRTCIALRPGLALVCVYVCMYVEASVRLHSLRTSWLNKERGGKGGPLS